MYRLNTKIHSTMLCLSGFELYSRWVPLIKGKIWSRGTNSRLPFGVNVGMNLNLFND